MWGNLEVRKGEVEAAQIHLPLYSLWSRQFICWVWKRQENEGGFRKGILWEAGKSNEWLLKISWRHQGLNRTGNHNFVIKLVSKLMWFPLEVLSRKPRVSGGNQGWANLGLEVVRGEAAATRAKDVTMVGSVYLKWLMWTLYQGEEIKGEQKLRGQRRVRRGELDAIEHKFNGNRGAWKLGF